MNGFKRDNFFFPKSQTFVGLKHNILKFSI